MSKQGNLLYFLGKSSTKTVESDTKKKKSQKKNVEAPIVIEDKPKPKKSDTKTTKRKVDQISDEDFDEQAPSSSTLTSSKKQKKSPQTKKPKAVVVDEVDIVEEKKEKTSKSKNSTKATQSQDVVKQEKETSSVSKGKEKKESPEGTSPKKKITPKKEMGIEDIIQNIDVHNKENKKEAAQSSEKKSGKSSKSQTPEKVELKPAKEEKLEVPVQETKPKSPSKSSAKPLPSPTKPLPSPTKKKLEFESKSPEKSSPIKKGKSPNKVSNIPSLEVETPKQTKDVPKKEVQVVEDIEAMEVESPVKKPLEIENAPKNTDSKPEEKEIPMVRVTSGYQDYLHRGGPRNKGTKEIPVGKPNCLYGKQFLITGVLDSLERDEASDLIQRYGGSIAKSFTKKLTHLIVGDGAGESKLEKAKQNEQVQILDEDGLLDLIRNSDAQKLPKNAINKTELLPPTPEKNIPSNKVVNVEHHTSSKSVRISPPNVNKNVSKISPVKGKKEEIHPAPSLLWTDKWKPKSIKDLVANPGIIEQLKKWLSNWKVATVKSKTGKISTQASHSKAALLSGQPGIGKTSAAILCAQECGYEPIEFNASDARSKKALQEEIEQLAGNRAIDEFYTSVQTPKTPKKKICIIMDEVDGMSSGDRGGMKELIALINKTTTPIICICNDRSSPKVKSLANHCLDLRFRKPTIQQAAARITNIARTEGFSVEPIAIEKLLDSTQCDIRQTLNLLQMWRRNMSQIRNTDDLKQKLDDASKTSVDVGPFDVVPKIFSDRTSVADKFELFYVDSSLVPLMVQENYLNAAPKKGDPIESYANAADSISEARSIMKDQNWELQSANAVLSTIRPASILGGQLAGRLGFPLFLGKTSSTNKRKRLLKDIQNHTSTSITGDKNEIRLQYLPLMRTKLLEPLVKDGADGVEPLLSWMDEYGLTRDDFDSVMELTSLDDVDPLQNVPTLVKSTFTRKYNQTHLAKISSKKSSAESEDAEEISIGELGEDEGIIKDAPAKEEEAETEDISADKLIKVKQTKKKEEGKSKKQKKDKDPSKPAKKKTKK